jgi:uncharacterized membrane protein
LRNILAAALLPLAMAQQSPSPRHDDAPLATSKDTQPSRQLVAASITINRRHNEIYERLCQLPRFAEFAAVDVSIETLDDRRSSWRVLTPEGKCYQWTAAITHKVECESLTWQSEPGGDIVHSGQVPLAGAPARGCILTINVAFERAAGLINKLKARLSSPDPAMVLRHNLVRFKQLMETGEIATAARRPDHVKHRSTEQI